ncbi:MAG TPA: ABC transporter ATP-binding protein [Alphaproteobacteria bacterium]|nr:ABC transporter ATP-binding protein [Alphaproteobacteria bacterium]
MIELDRVSKRYGARAAVDGLSLMVERGEFFVVIGPSGSGKSTTLKLINRLVALSAGSIRIDGEDVLRFKAEELRRRMGYVFQSIGLFPHWTVERNIGTVPELLGWPKAKIRDRATELLTLLKLDPDGFRGKYPHQLSGGEQQRVGVARALAANPGILLMDEPFGAVDPITRGALQEEIARIHAESRTTIVFVTHDIDEALKLASRIAILEQGRLVQIGTPADLLSAPATDFVRDFVGREDLGVRLLSVEPVANRVRDGDAPGEPIAASASLRQALSRMIAQGTDRLAVVDADGRRLGVLMLADLTRP